MFCRMLITLYNSLYDLMFSQKELHRKTLMKDHFGLFVKCADGLQLLQDNQVKGDAAGKDDLILHGGK